MKKLISLALVLVMTLSILPAAFAGVTVADKAAINKVTKAPAIDGTIEADWGNALAAMEYDVSEASFPTGAKAEFWYVWDDTNLYGAVRVTMKEFEAGKTGVQVRVDLNGNGSIWDGPDVLAKITIDGEGKAFNMTGADSIIGKGQLAGKKDGDVYTWEFSAPISALGETLKVENGQQMKFGLHLTDTAGSDKGATLTQLPFVDATSPEEEKPVIEITKPRSTITLDGNLTVEEWGAPTVTQENDTTKVDFYFRHDDKGLYFGVVAKSEVIVDGYQSGLVYRYQKSNAAAPGYIGCSVVRTDGSQVNNLTGTMVRNGADIVMEIFQTWEALGLTKGQDIYGQFQWLDYSEQTTSVCLNPNGSDVIADYITFKCVDKVAPEKAETAAPTTPTTPSTGTDAPSTFDAAIIAVVVAAVSGAGAVISKKRK